MGLLSNLFGNKKKKNNSEVFIEYTSKLLKLLNLPSTDANKLKASVYLLLAQMAIVHVISSGKSSIFIDNLVKDVIASVKPLMVKLKDIANDENELAFIISDFKDPEMNGEVTTNGLGAFESIYHSFGVNIVNDISKNSGGPLGSHGYAAIKVLEGMRGKGNGKTNFMETSLLLTEMTGEVIQAFR